jgi:hypothetical protein
MDRMKNAAARQDHRKVRTKKTFVRMDARMFRTSNHLVVRARGWALRRV